MRECLLLEKKFCDLVNRLTLLLYHFLHSDLAFFGNIVHFLVNGLFDFIRVRFSHKFNIGKGYHLQFFRHAEFNHNVVDNPFSPGQILVSIC